MEQWLELFISVTTEFARLFIVSRYCKIFFTHDYKRIRRFAAYICSYVMTTCTYNWFHNALINSIMTFLGLFIIACTYKGSISKKIFFSALVFGVSCATDLLAFSIIPDADPRRNSDIWVFFLSLLFFWACTWICRHLFRSPKEEFTKNYGWSILIISLTLTEAIYVILEGASISHPATFMICVLMMIINFAVSHLYEVTGVVYKREYENILFQEQIKAYEKQLALMIESDKKIHSLRHDMKHHLKEISGMALAHKDAKILQYVENMYGYMDVPEQTVDTGNVSVDGILNYKLAEAKSCGIPVQVHILFPETLNISNFDMNILFGNLLDNAIEASRKLEKPFIDLNVKYRQDCLYIRISNRYDGTVHEEGRVLLSLKEQKSEHGYGLYGVRKIVEKYAGSLEITHSDDIFLVRISLLLH